MKRAFTLIELLIVIAIIAILALIAIPNFLEAQTRAKVARVKADMRSIATAIEAYFVDENSYPLMNREDNRVNHRIRYSSYLWLDWPGNQGDALWEKAIATWLTTPIAYLSSAPPLDPFGTADRGMNATYTNYGYFFYNFLSCAQAAARGDYTQLNNETSQTTGETYQIRAPVPFKLNGINGSVHPVNWAMLSAGPFRQYRNVCVNLGEPWYVTNTYYVSRNHYWKLVDGEGVNYDPTNGTISPGCIWRMQGRSQ